MSRLTPSTQQVLEQNQMIPDLGRRMKEILDQEMWTYDTKAAQTYLAGIHEARRKDLLNKLHSHIDTLCAHQLTILRSTCAKKFEEDLRVSC